MKLKSLFGIWLIIILVISISIPTVNARNDTEDIYDSENVHEDQYWTYVTNPDTTADSYRIYIHWNSDYTIDVWLVDEDEYYNYKNGHFFTSLYDMFGKSGVIDVTLYEHDYEDGPFYAIFDNTDLGNAKPAWDNVDNIAYVTIDGEITKYYDDIPNFFDTSDDNLLSYLLCPILFIIGLVVLIIIVVVYLSKKNKYQPPQPTPQQYPPQRSPQPPPEQYSQREPPPPPCPKCKSGMKYINQYQKWYCDRCNKYQ